MKLLLQNGLTPERSAPFFHHIQDLLRNQGVAVDVVEQPDLSPLPLETYNLAVSNLVIPPACRARVPCYGSQRFDRGTSLTLLAQSGLSVMPWTRAENRRHILKLFDTWPAQRLLLKRSGTFGGTGVTAFTRDGIDQLEWQVDRDIFCPELNPDRGDVYKAEVFGGNVVMAWSSTAPPLREIMHATVRHGIPGVYGERALHPFPEAVHAKLQSVARTLHGMGLGHCSIDLMQDVQGAYQAIEINTGLVALWWTQQFDFFRERMGKALLQMLTHAAQTYPR